MREIRMLRSCIITHVVYVCASISPVPIASTSREMDIWRGQIMPIEPGLLKKIESTLIAGGYSLLLGAGVSRDSRNAKRGRSDGRGVAAGLNHTEEAKRTSSLARAYGSLTAGEIDTYITDRLVNCIPGPTLLSIPQFNWHRIFTFNIDDASEESQR